MIHTGEWCFSTLKILATVKLTTEEVPYKLGFSTLKILATVKQKKLHVSMHSVLVPLRF